MSSVAVIGTGILIDIKRIKEQNDYKIIEKMESFTDYCMDLFDNYHSEHFVFITKDAQHIGDCEMFYGAGGIVQLSIMEEGQPTRMDLRSFCVSLDGDKPLKMIQNFKDYENERQQMIDSIGLSFDKDYQETNDQYKEQQFEEAKKILLSEQMADCVMFGKFLCVIVEY